MDLSFLQLLNPTKDTTDIPQVDLSKIDDLTEAYYGTTKLNKLRYKSIQELRGKDDVKKIYENVKDCIPFKGQYIYGANPLVRTITHLDSPQYKDYVSIKETLVYLWIIQNGEVGKEYILEEIIHGSIQGLNSIKVIKLT